MNGFYVFMFLVEKRLNSMIITYKIIFHILLSIHSTISCWKEVKWRKVIFCFKIAFFNPMTVWEDHVGNDYANRLGSIYACRKWKSLGVRDILKWQKWAQPMTHACCRRLILKKIFSYFWLKCTFLLPTDTVQSYEKYFIKIY